MKNKLPYIIGAIAIVILFAATGCKKDRNNTTGGTAKFGLHLHTFIGDSLVSPGALNVFNPDSLGRVEQLYHAQFYITNISLHSTTKGWYVMPNTIMLKREENEVYNLGNVPADVYDDIRFTVGLGNTLNSGSPSGYPTTGTDSVLSTLESAMYFGPNQGYKFMSLAGVVDTTAHHNGTIANFIPFSYDLGGSADTVNVTFPVYSPGFTFYDSSIVANYQLIHITCDYGHLLQNINIAGDPTSRTGSTFGTTQQQSVAAQVWNYILGMFRYECSAPNGVC